MPTSHKNLSFKQKLLHILFTTRCACCNKVIYAHQTICRQCEEQLPYIGEGECAGCGKPLKQCICKNKTRTKIPCVSPFYYKGCIQKGLLTMKTNSLLHGAPFFAAEMAKVVGQNYSPLWDGIVYVPITKKKLRSRGFNQSYHLAKELGKQLNLPVIQNALIRLYNTPDQHTSDFVHRSGNVFGVFDANPHLVKGKRLLLVDDIVTTGATINECAKMLFLNDAQQVAAVTVASTTIHTPHNPCKYKTPFHQRISDGMGFIVIKRIVIPTDQCFASTGLSRWSALRCYPYRLNS